MKRLKVVHKGDGYRNLSAYLGARLIAENGGAYGEGDSLNYEWASDVRVKALLESEPFQAPPTRFMLFAESVFTAAGAVLLDVYVSDGTIKLGIGIYADIILNTTEFHPRTLMLGMQKALRAPLVIDDEPGIIDREGKTRELQEWTLGITYTVPFEKTIGQHVADANKELEDLVERVTGKVSSHKWQDHWGQDEEAFTRELLVPLFRKMGFEDVQYNHGKREFGRDVVCKKSDEFGIQRYHGIQAKAGNISGQANSLLDTIIGQIGDAFSMPFIDTMSRSKVHISMFYVICSGAISDNAKEKILAKISPGLQGAISFFDKQKLEELMQTHLRDDGSRER